jgi:hypothetical protein
VKAAKTPAPKLDDLAQRIREHLERLEADKEWNRWTDPTGTPRPRLWRSGACRSGSRVSVAYISYQGSCTMTRDEAVRYLAALDAGFRGRHFEALRNKQQEAT